MRPRLAPALCAALVLAAGCTHPKSVFLPRPSPPPSVIPGPTLQTDTVKTCLARRLPSSAWHQAAASALGADTFVVGFGRSNAATIYVEENGRNVIAEEEAILQAQDTTHGFPSIMRGKGNILVTWANQPRASQSAVVKGCVGFG